MSKITPDQPPPRVTPSIKAAPKIRQLYWCRLPDDAELPEFWKLRPVVVVSFKHVLHGHCSVIPTTTAEQVGNPWAVKLATSFDGRASWAVCNHPLTVANSRLRVNKGVIPRVTEAEFGEILQRLLAWLPKQPGT
jgi:mRNA interferase MazF